MTGRMLGHYRILEKLGEGGMGVVYHAEDTRLGRSVALKALPAEHAHDPDHRRRFHQEARAVAALNHPGIATLHELAEVGEDLYLVFEYVRGETLRQPIQRGRLDLETLLELACAIADALAAAHSQGVVHRDLKPENIIRTPAGSPKILDFGLARFQASALDPETVSTRLTDPGSILGTVAYMAPEQLEGKEADFRADIFSFGVLLYELATGDHPFESGTPASTIARIMSAEASPLRERNPLAPPELDRIVRKCLRKRPEERYQSTRDLAVDLGQLRRESGEARAVTVGAKEEEPALVQRAFRRWGLTPRRWWELDTLAGLIVFYPLMIYFAWKVKEWTQEPWALFGVLHVMAPFSLRVFLLSTAAFNPAALAREVRRLAPWLAFAHGLTLVGLLVLASMIWASHTGYATVLVGFVVVGVVAVAIIHPAITRAAFPEVGARERPAPGLAECQRMGWIHAIYLIPFGFFTLIVPGSIAEVIGGPSGVHGISPVVITPALYIAEVIRAPGGVVERALVGMVAYWAVVLALGIVIGKSMLALWEGNRQGVRIFYRWFPVFFLADLLAVALLVGVLAEMRGVSVLVAGFLVVPVLLYLPFYQRRMARKLLREFERAA